MMTSARAALHSADEGLATTLNFIHTHKREPNMLTFDHRSYLLQIGATLVLGMAVASSAEAAPSYGFSVRMSGYSDNTASYAFAYPEFTFTNLSSTGIGISSISMNDGASTHGGLWDYVSGESASTGIGYTLTQGDRINDAGWGTTIAYNFTGFDASKAFGFYVDPDTLHAGTGNVVDARPYVFAGGTATATFTNGATMTLTWSNPAIHSFSPLRLPNQPALDARNIYYEMGNSVVIPSAVPEPKTYAIMLVGLGFLGCVVRRKKASISQA